MAAAAEEGELKHLRKLVAELSQERDELLAKQNSNESKPELGMAHLTAHTFTLERYFAKYEFQAEHLLCCSDCEPISLNDALACADTECKTMWDNLSLGYTESNGLPLLRHEVAAMYDNIVDEGILIGAPQELILIGISRILQAGDHCIVTWPGYQSLYETCTAAGASVDFINVAGASFDVLAEIKAKTTPHTKALIVNFPHNPTGYIPTREEFDAIVHFAKDHGWFLFCDEMYRWLEHDSADRLPSACEVYDRAITLSGVSKSLSMPGVRVGWLASQNTHMVNQIAKLKDYTTICTPGPSEVLALIAIRNRNTLVAQNCCTIARNKAKLKEFLAKFTDMISWEPPKAGSICFPQLIHPKAQDANLFCKRLVDTYGVLLLPGSVYENHTNRGTMSNRFRLGLGRNGMEDALQKLEKFLLELRSNVN